MTRIQHGHHVHYFPEHNCLSINPTIHTCDVTLTRTRKRVSPPMVGPWAVALSERSVTDTDGCSNCSNSFSRGSVEDRSTHRPGTRCGIPSSRGCGRPARRRFDRAVYRTLSKGSHWQSGRYAFADVGRAAQISA